MKTFMKPTFLFMARGAVMLFTTCNKDKNDSPSTAKNLYFALYAENTVNKIDLVDDPNNYDELFGPADGFDGPSAMTMTNDGYLIVAEENGDDILKMKKDGTGEVEE